MAKNDTIKRRTTDPKYIESIRIRFNHLYKEYGEITAENAMKIIKFNTFAWNNFGNPAAYQFGNKIEIH
jgi:hypothetical protein